MLSRTQNRAFSTLPLRKFSLTKTLPTSPSKLFRVVSNVSDYANFLPFVNSSTILTTEVAEASKSLVQYESDNKFIRSDKTYRKQFLATLTVGYENYPLSTLTDTYTSLVTLNKTVHRDSNEVVGYKILARDVGDSSIFYGLGSQWLIYPANQSNASDGGSKVDFTVWYTVSSSHLASSAVDFIMANSIQSIAKMQMDSFVRRCEEA
jgi:ribosome-associated toxin RatA of RatAB toxin-antitoxin module